LPLTPHFPYYFRVDGAILAYSLLAANGIYLLFFQLLLILLLNALRNLIASTYILLHIYYILYRLSGKLSALPADEVVKSQLVSFPPNLMAVLSSSMYFPAFTDDNNDDDDDDGSGN